MVIVYLGSVFGIRLHFLIAGKQQQAECEMVVVCIERNAIRGWFPNGITFRNTLQPLQAITMMFCGSF